MEFRSTGNYNLSFGAGQSFGIVNNRKRRLIFAKLPSKPNVHNPERYGVILENHGRYCMVRQPKIRLPRRRSSLEGFLRGTHLTGWILTAWILVGQISWAGPLTEVIARSIGAFSHSGPCAQTPAPTELALADPKDAPPQPAAADTAVAWETDYVHAMDLANRQRKMLLTLFVDPANEWSRRLEAEALANAEVRAKLQGYICLRLPMDATTQIDGKDIRLLDHPSFQEMLGQPGIAIADFSQAGPLHGSVVSVFPVSGRRCYGSEETKVILDLPPGTLTQRTLIYAVRTHPEHPASAIGEPDLRLETEAQSHSEYQARIRRQGHHHWDSRFHRISGLLGCTAREVCAESWPGQGLLEAAIECVRCWRLSSGHWSAVRARNRAFGYDMKQGANGIWYATGIFGMR